MEDAGYKDLAMHLSHNDHEGEEKGEPHKRTTRARLATACKTFSLIEVSQAQATKQCRNLVLIEAALFGRRFARHVQVSLMT